MGNLLGAVLLCKLDRAPPTFVFGRPDSFVQIGHNVEHCPQNSRAVMRYGKYTALSATSLKMMRLARKKTRHKHFFLNDALPYSLIVLIPECITLCQALLVEIF